MSATPFEVQHADSPVAPAWHSVVTLATVVLLSWLGARSHGLSPFQRWHGRAVGYVFVIAVEWLVVGFIAWGISLRNLRLRDLLGPNWIPGKGILRDIGIAIGFLVVANLVLGLLGYLLKSGPSRVLRDLFPHGTAEIVVYLLLTVTAGICEEVIFRGYLQRQFAAVTRSATLGVALQGIAFGMAHGYQGTKSMLIIAVFGTMFGILAAWRRSLRPGMAAHFVQDAVFGLLGSYFMK